MVKCGCCNKVMRYTYSQTMNQYFYTCTKCKTRIYLDDIRAIISEDIQNQISAINSNEVKKYTDLQIKKIKKEIEDIEAKIQNTFEQFINSRITEESLKARIDELNTRKNELQQILEENKTTELEKELLSLTNKKITDNLIIKLVASAAITNTGRRKYSAHINYNFKNQIIGA